MRASGWRRPLDNTGDVDDDDDMTAKGRKISWANRND